MLSGEANGRIFYEKVMVTCGGRLINSFAMIYPIDQRHIFDPIVERVEDTFRPARDCKRAGLALPPTSLRTRLLGLICTSARPGCRCHPARTRPPCDARSCAATYAARRLLGARSTIVQICSMTTGVGTAFWNLFVMSALSRPSTKYLGSTPASVIVFINIQGTHP